MGAFIRITMRRDRIVVAVALAVVTLLAWAYVLWLLIHMASMDMNGAARLLTPGFRSWSPADFAFMFAMWSVMMVGMMTPSVAPMVLLYAAAGRKAAESGATYVSTGWFFAGYILVWIGFSLIATGGQWLLTSLSLLSPMMATSALVSPSKPGRRVGIPISAYQKETSPILVMERVFRSIVFAGHLLRRGRLTRPLQTSLVQPSKGLIRQRPDCGVVPNGQRHSRAGW